MFFFTSAKAVIWTALKVSGSAADCSGATSSSSVSGNSTPSAASKAAIDSKTSPTSISFSPK